MKRVIAVAIVVGVLAIVGVLGGYYVKTHFPNVGPPPDIRVAGTPEQIARGRYLAHHVTVCLECHSTRDWALFSAPPIPGTEGKGGQVFSEAAGFPGTLGRAQYHAGRAGRLDGWRDHSGLCEWGEQKRRSPFSLMPYRAYRFLMTEDAEAIVAYLRTLRPLTISRRVPR